MTTKKQIEDYIKRRNEAFETDDMDWVRDRAGNITDEAVIEMAFHKARLAAGGVSLTKRQESLDWLRHRGYGDWRGGPLPEAISETDTDPFEALANLTKDPPE